MVSLSEEERQCTTTYAHILILGDSKRDPEKVFWRVPWRYPRYSWLARSGGAYWVLLVGLSTQSPTTWAYLHPTELLGNWGKLYKMYVHASRKASSLHLILYVPIPHTYYTRCYHTRTYVCVQRVLVYTYKCGTLQNAVNLMRYLVYMN